MNSIFDMKQADVARALNRDRSIVCRWFKKRKIPVSELERIETILGFKREDVRPDLPWRK